MIVIKELGDGYNDYDIYSEDGYLPDDCFTDASTTSIAGWALDRFIKSIEDKGLMYRIEYQNSEWW